MLNSSASSEDDSSSSAKEKKEELLSPNNCTQIDVDNVLARLGRFGKYQLLQSCLLILGSMGITPPIIGGIFTGRDVKFKCAGNWTTSLSSNASAVFASSCDDLAFAEDGRCQEYVYDSDIPQSSYISQWDMVCDKETLGHLAQILTMVGMALGAFFFPPLGDRFGRKKLLVVSEAAVLLIIGGMAFSTSFEMFVVLKFLSGAANQGQCVAERTLHMELYPVEQRSAVCFVYIVTWCVSYALLVGVSWFLQDYSWTTLQLVYACFSAGLFLQIFFQDESLRWLISKGHVHKAKALLKKACKKNGKNYSNLIASIMAENSSNRKEYDGEKHEMKTPSQKQQTLLVHCHDKELNQSSKTNMRRTTFLDLVRTPGLRKITVIMAYTWFTNSLTYYGLTLMSSSLFGDLYFNNVVAAILELVSGVMVVFSIYRYGRKKTLTVFILLAGISLLTTVLLVNFAPSTKVYFILQTVMAQMGKCFISGSFNTIWCYTQELYPTAFRNMGVGVSSAAARVGASLSPLFTLLVKYIPWAPGTIFSLGCFLCVFMLIALPETRYRELPHSIDEIEKWFTEDEKKKNNNRNKEGKEWEEKKTKYEKRNLTNVL